MESVSATRNHSGRKTARRSRSVTGAENTRTPAFAGNGFLKQVFAPVITGLPVNIRDQQNIERSFFQSLGYLSAHFGFPPNEFSGTVYPYNIHLAFEDAQHQLNGIDPYCSLRIVQDKSRPACIECEHNAGTGNCLLYIPVETLNRLSKQREKKPTANLLLSLYAWLYNAGVSYYRNEGDFLYYEYEMLENWYQEDDLEDESVLQNLADLATAKKQGNSWFKKIAGKSNLNAFEQRLNKYQPNNNWEQRLKMIAITFLELSIAYPAKSYYDNIQPALMDNGEEDYNPMRPDHYLSFFWSEEGEIYNQLIQCVNNELGEMYGREEPIKTQLFDQPYTDIRLLDFEKRLLDGVDELCYLLNQY
jgi:hypothetical protein